MSSVKFILLILIIYQLTGNAFAIERNIATILPSDKYCQLVFHTAAEDFNPHLLEQGKDYVVVYGSELLPVKGAYQDTVKSSEGVLLHRFIQENHRVLEVPNVEVVSILPLDRPYIAEQTMRQSEMYNSIASAKGFLSLWLAPFSTLAHKGSIEVVGKAISSRALAREVIDLVGEVDQHLVRTGLQKPAQTRIIINDKPIMRDMLGPAAIRIPIYNIWSRDHKSLIHLGAWGKNTKVISNPSVLAHERVHTYLFETYENSDFIAQNSTFEEAICDFLTAHIFDDPRVGFNVFVPGKTLRNIETRSFLTGQQQAGFIHNIHSASLSDFHSDSLLYSNILWRLRKAVSKSDIEPMVKMIIDLSNRSYIPPSPSAAMQLHQGENMNRVMNSMRKEFHSDFHLFVAAVKVSAEKFGHAHKVEKLIQSLHREHYLDSSEVDRLTSVMRDYANTF